jgi:hypothetical protein
MPLPCDEKDRLLDELSSLSRQLNLSVMESLYSGGVPADSLSRQGLGERIDQLKRSVTKARAVFDRHLAEHGCGSGPGTRF